MGTEICLVAASFFFVHISGGLSGSGGGIFNICPAKTNVEDIRLYSFSLGKKKIIVKGDEFKKSSPYDVKKDYKI